MAKSNEEIKGEMPKRLEILQSLLKEIEFRFQNAAIEIDVPELAYSVTIPQKDGELSIQLNIPYTVMLRFKDYEYGSDYIKTDDDWRRIGNDVIEITEQILRNNFGEVAYLHKGKTIAGYLELRLSNKVIKIENPSRPFFAFRLKKVRIKHLKSHPKK
jgi:hypothetical protein